MQHVGPVIDRYETYLPWMLTCPGVGLGFRIQGVALGLAWGLGV